VTNAAQMCTTSGTLRYQSPGPPDEHNDPSDTWTEVDVKCAIQMRGRQEDPTTGELSTTTWLAFFPIGIGPPRSVDQLVVDGVTYQFRGDSWVATGTRGRADHIEATLERAE
jgi:hypothetical protein